MRLDPARGELVGITLLDFEACWGEVDRIELEVPALGETEPEATERRGAEHSELVLA